MKNVQEPIQVRWDSQSKLMEWRQRCYAIEEVFERWYYRGKWWLSSHLQGESRVYYRVLCNLRGVPPAGGVPPEGGNVGGRIQPSRQIGPYSDSVRTRKHAPRPTLVTDSKIFEIYCVDAKSWVLSRVID